jgi:hypothetical protein
MVAKFHRRCERRTGEANFNKTCSRLFTVSALQRKASALSTEPEYIGSLSQLRSRAYLAEHQFSPNIN